MNSKSSSISPDCLSLAFCPIVIPARPNSVMDCRVGIGGSMRMHVDGAEIDVAEFQCTMFRISAACVKGYDPSELFSPERPKDFALRGLFGRSSYATFSDRTLDACGSAYADESTDVIHMDQIFVTPEWRGRRLGLYAMRALAGAFAFDHSALLVYQPIPAQCVPRNDLLPDQFKRYELDKFDNRAAPGTARLRQYFAAVGFQHVPGTTCWVHDLGLCFRRWDMIDSAASKSAAR